jgi:hypothetical protein
LVLDELANRGISAFESGGLVVVDMNSQDAAELLLTKPGVTFREGLPLCRLAT